MFSLRVAALQPETSLHQRKSKLSTVKPLKEILASCKKDLNLWKARGQACNAHLQTKPGVPLGLIGLAAAVVGTVTAVTMRVRVVGCK
jgi:hypothetical protein